MLKAAFGWLVELRLVEGNPFEHVEQPDLDRREIKFVRQGDIGEFFDWLEERYPGWAMPRLFFSVKAATACRLEDVCSLLSHQLQDGWYSRPKSPRTAPSATPSFPPTWTRLSKP